MPYGTRAFEVVAVAASKWLPSNTSWEFATQKIVRDPFWYSGLTSGTPFLLEYETVSSTSTSSAAASRSTCHDGLDAIAKGKLAPGECRGSRCGWRRRRLTLGIGRSHRDRLGHGLITRLAYERCPPSVKKR
jgi:hypothetical protein